MAAKVQTVLGPVDGSSLGRTLTHEHFSLDFNTFYVEAPEKVKPHIGEQISLQNAGFIKQYPYSSRYNMHYDDEDAHRAVEYDVALFKEHGGGTIVENTSHGLNRQLNLMKHISATTGVNVIAGTGHYVEAVQRQSELSKSEEKLLEMILADMTVGCPEDASVKCGFIGEVGSSWPITDFEKRAIRAAAAAQQQLKCAVSFHPARDPAAPFEILRIYMEAGGDPKRTIMSHIDRTLSSKESVLALGELGVFCQCDLFGIECSWYQLKETWDMPSDAQRIDLLRYLVDAGRADQVLTSHDIHTKHRLTKFGGHGFSHILSNVIPKMRIKGFSQEMIDKITISNPRRWLTGQ